VTRLGVDVGGTFTDLIFYDDETGEVRVSKNEEAARRDYPHTFDR
jgi:N-methylhydantoinase A/oxoprolinase/acetone carboxylase beta subunit